MLKYFYFYIILTWKCTRIVIHWYQKLILMFTCKCIFWKVYKCKFLRDSCQEWIFISYHSNFKRFISSFNLDSEELFSKCVCMHMHTHIHVWLHKKLESVDPQRRQVKNSVIIHILILCRVVFPSSVFSRVVSSVFSENKRSKLEIYL